MKKIFLLFFVINIVNVNAQTEQNKILKEQFLTKESIHSICQNDKCIVYAVLKNGTKHYIDTFSDTNKIKVEEKGESILDIQGITDDSVASHVFIDKVSLDTSKIFYAFLPFKIDEKNKLYAELDDLNDQQKNIKIAPLFLIGASPIILKINDTDAKIKDINFDNDHKLTVTCINRAQVNKQSFEFDKTKLMDYEGKILFRKEFKDNCKLSPEQCLIPTSKIVVVSPDNKQNIVLKNLSDPEIQSLHVERYGPTLVGVVFSNGSPPIKQTIFVDTKTLKQSSNAYYFVSAVDPAHEQIVYQDLDKGPFLANIFEPSQAIRIAKCIDSEKAENIVNEVSGYSFKNGKLFCLGKK